MIDPLHVEEIARDIGPVISADMKMRLAGLGMHGRMHLLKSIKDKVARTRQGEPFGIAFNLVRHGIFIDKGAGRGYGGRKKNNRMGNDLRPARPWLWVSIDARMGLLAERVASRVADEAEAMIESAKINIRVK